MTELVKQTLKSQSKINLKFNLKMIFIEIQEIKIYSNFPVPYFCVFLTFIFKQ